MVDWKCLYGLKLLSECFSSSTHCLQPPLQVLGSRLQFIVVLMS